MRIITEKILAIVVLTLAFTISLIYCALNLSGNDAGLLIGIFIVAYIIALESVRRMPNKDYQDQP